MLPWIFLATAPAQPGTPGAQAAGTGGFIISLLPFVVLFGIMWLLLIRPQKKQQEAHRRMLSELKKGDRVLTAGGLIGEITEIDEDEVKLRIADKVEARFIKSAVNRVLKG
ncbi:MAG: preprotein translocase subunit YajC [Patescibacteria group bacterium]